MKKLLLILSAAALMGIMLGCGSASAVPETTAAVSGDVGNPVESTGPIVHTEQQPESAEQPQSVVFFGDSITAWSGFEVRFADYGAVNQGIPGDTISDLLERTDAVAMADPGRIFLLVGINELRDEGIAASLERYQRLLDALEAMTPEAEIYVQSVLPVAAEAEPYLCTNETIQIFNKELASFAADRGHVFIDLYSLYEKNGQLDPQLTPDGLHLLPEAYDRWAERILPYME